MKLICKIIGHKYDFYKLETGNVIRSCKNCSHIGELKILPIYGQAFYAPVQFSKKFADHNFEPISNNNNE